MHPQLFFKLAQKHEKKSELCNEWQTKALIKNLKSI